MSKLISWKKTNCPQEYLSSCGNYNVYKHDGQWTVYIKGGPFSDKPKFRTLKAAKLACEEHKANRAGDHNRAFAFGLLSLCNK